LFRVSLGTFNNILKQVGLKLDISFYVLREALIKCIDPNGNSYGYVVEFLGIRLNQNFLSLWWLWRKVENGKKAK